MGEAGRWRNLGFDYIQKSSGLDASTAPHHITKDVYAESGHWVRLPPRKN
jgi:hypothetical protein